MVTAFVLTISFARPYSLVSLLALLVADAIILRNYWRLYTLSKQYSLSGDASLADGIAELSSGNPKWINLAQLSIVVLAIVLVVARFSLWP